MNLEYHQKTHKALAISLMIISIVVGGLFIYFANKTEIMQRRIAYYFVTGLMAFGIFQNIKKIFNKKYFVYLDIEKIEYFLPGKTGMLKWEAVSQMYIISDENVSLKLDLKDDNYIILSGKYVGLKSSEIRTFIVKELKEEYPDIIFYYGKNRI